MDFEPHREPLGGSSASARSTAGAEGQLLAQWCSGSRSAGDRLLRRCVPFLERYFAQKAGDAAADLVQQTLLTCTRHRHEILERGAFSGYLLQVARSRLFDHLRTQQRLAHRNWYGLISSTSELAPDQIDRTRIAVELRAVLDALAGDLREVLVLHYWHDLTTAEIGTRLALPRGTVKSRLRRAREAIFEALEHEARHQ